jgi:hypothetical protein
VGTGDQFAVAVEADVCFGPAHGIAVEMPMTKVRDKRNDKGIALLVSKTLNFREYHELSWRRVDMDGMKLEECRSGRHQFLRPYPWYQRLSALSRVQIRQGVLNTGFQDDHGNMHSINRFDWPSLGVVRLKQGLWLARFLASSSSSLIDGNLQISEFVLWVSFGIPRVLEWFFVPSLR